MRPVGLWTAAIGCLGLFVVAGLAFAPALFTPTPDGALGVAAIGGPFTLTDDRGRPVTQAALAGKPSAIYFGYTYCPDVCPTTLADLSRWIHLLGPEVGKANFIFVTVDPERDTPTVLRQYLAAFDSRIRGFTGTPPQIAQITREYRVFHSKAPSKDGYFVEHSAVIYLMAANGSFVGVIPYQAKDDFAVSKLKSLIEQDS